VLIQLDRWLDTKKRDQRLNIRVTETTVVSRQVGFLGHGHVIQRWWGTTSGELIFEELTIRDYFDDEYEMPSVLQT
jgi:hypothetical protein